LKGCTSLISINLSFLSNTTSIYDDFLEECSKLESIDLSSLINVTSIGNGFLNECYGLVTIIINNETSELLRYKIENFVNINIINNDIQFTNFNNDMEKITTDKEFCKKLIKYLGLQKSGSHKSVIKQLTYLSKQYKKNGSNKLQKYRNEQDLFSGEEICDIPEKRLVCVENINGTYNVFDVVLLRKYLFDKKKNEYRNPLTTNKICDDDLNKILNVNVRQLNYFM